jgi:hypothetical protein
MSDNGSNEDFPSSSTYYSRLDDETIQIPPNTITSSQDIDVVNSSSFRFQREATRQKKISEISDRFLTSVSKMRRNRSSSVYEKQFTSTMFNEIRGFDENIERKVRILSLTLTVLALFGLVILILTNVLNFLWYTDLPNKSLVDPSNRNVTANFMAVYTTYEVFKFINVAVTMICIIILFAMYNVLSEIKRKQYGFSTRFRAFIYTTLKFKFTAEFLVLIITPIPGVSMVQAFDWYPGDKIGLIMFLRLYLLVRVLRDFSSVYQKRFKIVASHPEYQKTVPMFGWSLTLRILFYTRTTSMLLLVTLISTGGAAFCIWVCERELNPSLLSYWNSLYFTVVTMATIGYGDITPITPEGRIFAICQCMIGVVLVTIACGVVVNKLTPTEEQIYAARYLQQEKFLKSRLEECVRILQIQWLWKKRKCTDFYHHNVLRRSLMRLKKVRTKLAVNENSITTHESLELLLKKNESMNHQVATLNNTITELKHLIKKMEH